MRNVLALAALLALAAPSAGAACYGGPAVQDCHDPYGNGDTNHRIAGITTMRGYDAQAADQQTKPIAASGKMDTQAIMAKAHGGTRSSRAEPPRRSLFFYTCTPYRGCQ
jgi:hypothetical protein